MKDIRKTYRMGEVEIHALSGVTFEINQGELCVVVGPSGAGKTTLLNILGGMDSATSGELIVDGEHIERYDRKQLTLYPVSYTHLDVYKRQHTKWNCKYHIVFAPKYRRKVFYEEKREDIREIIRTLCKWKGVDIIEGEICPDHIHLLLNIPPKISVSGFMGYLKAVSYTHLDVYKRQI